MSARSMPIGICSSADIRVLGATDVAPMLAFVAALADPLCLAGFASVTPDDFVTTLAWHRAARAAGYSLPA